MNHSSIIRNKTGTALGITFVMFALVGCSKHEAKPSNSPSKSAPAASAGASAPQIAFVECAETKEKAQISGQALTFLEQKQYAELEALAKKYRDSKERYADGLWKLAAVYNGLEPASGASAAEWRSRIDQINAWAKARPKSVMPNITLARILTSYAWVIRGGGFAGEVKDEDFKIFFQRLQQAFGYLQSAKRLEEKCPVYYSSLLQVALGLQFDRKKYDAICAEATKAYPDYVYYYTQRAMYLLPRWYGKEGEWQTDLAQSAARIGGDAGDMLFTQVAWANVDYGTEGNIVRNNKEVWSRIDRGFGLLLKEYPDSLAAKSGRAYLAALAGEKMQARNYFAETHGKVDLCHWMDKQQFEKFLAWTYSP